MHQADVVSHFAASAGRQSLVGREAGHVQTPLEGMVKDRPTPPKKIPIVDSFHRDSQKRL
jgi:hypothetical protein